MFVLHPCVVCGALVAPDKFHLNSRIVDSDGMAVCGSDGFPLIDVLCDECWDLGFRFSNNKLCDSIDFCGQDGCCGCSSTWTGFPSDPRLPSENNTV